MPEFNGRIADLAGALIALSTCLAPDAFAQSVSTNSSIANEVKKEAFKDKQEEHKPADPDTGKSTLSDETLNLLPNPYSSKGIKFSASYIGDVLGNITGVRRGAVYNGRLNVAVDLDMDKLAKMSGLTFHANVFQIHGKGLSRDYIGNLATVSSIEALATTRLYEAWFEQQLGGKAVTLRFGQLAADTEFITTKYADAFINGTYGWPVITGTDLPSGGPSPPLAAVGARLKGVLNQNVTVLAAAFNGDPAGPGPDDPQSRNRYGSNFRTQDGLLALGEIQYAYGQSKDTKALPGTIKLGGWYHSGRFDDLHYAANGYSLASPLATTPRQLQTDYGVYAVAEQRVLVLPGHHEGKRGLAVFVRAAYSQPDRNLVTWYIDGGLSVLGPFSARPDDKLGFGFAIAKISGSAKALDQDYVAAGDPLRIPRSKETILTVGYLAQIRQGWTVQPNIQYVMRPGGGYTFEAGQPRLSKNALVLAVRSVTKF
jgi:porin